MNVERVIKSPNVIMGLPVMVGGGIPILQQAEAVASAAWSKFEVPKAFHTALADVNLDPGIQPSVPKADIVDQANQVAESAWNRPQLSWWLVPTIAVRYSLPSPIIPPRVESHQPTYIQADQAVARSVSGISYQRTQAVPSTNLLPQQAEQLTQETEIVAKPAADQDKIRLAKQQNLEEERLINVEDWQVSKQRRNEIKKAIERAKIEAVKSGIRKILGWMVANFLPGQHEGNISQLVRKKGPDGSLVDTEQAIKEDPREFKSEQEAREGLLPYVGLFKPAKKALKGEPLPKQHVVRVLRFVKHIFAYEVFVQRIIKKRVAVENGIELVLENKVDTYSEPNIADLGLSAVFNKGLTDLNSLS